jgi:hypothetical protein
MLEKAAAGAFYRDIVSKAPAAIRGIKQLQCKSGRTAETYQLSGNLGFTIPVVAVTCGDRSFSPVERAKSAGCH